MSDAPAPAVEEPVAAASKLNSASPVSEKRQAFVAVLSQDDRHWRLQYKGVEVGVSRDAVLSGECYPGAACGCLGVTGARPEARRGAAALLAAALPAGRSLRHEALLSTTQGLRGSDARRPIWQNEPLWTVNEGAVASVGLAERNGPVGRACGGRGSQTHHLELLQYARSSTCVRFYLGLGNSCGR